MVCHGENDAGNGGDAGDGEGSVAGGAGGVLGGGCGGAGSLLVVCLNGNNGILQLTDVLVGRILAP